MPFWDYLTNKDSALDFGNKLFIDPGGIFDPAPSAQFTPEEYRPGDSRFYNSQQARDFQQALYNQSMGWGGPSVAEHQMRQGLNEAQRGAMALGHSQRGTSAAAALRMSQRAGTQAAADTAAKAAALRAQEQMAARNQYQGFLGQADQSQLARDQIIANQRNAYNALMMQKSLDSATAERKKQAGILGAAGSVVAGILSDERTKEDIKKPKDKEVKSFLGALQGYTYKYKDGDMPGDDKPKFGVMAQDLAKTALGKRAVNEIEYERAELKPVKKMKVKRLAIDMQGALGAALAGLGNLNKRLEKLEG